MWHGVSSCSWGRLSLFVSRCAVSPPFLLGTHWLAACNVAAHFDRWALYGLRMHTCSGTEIVCATWDADAQHYIVLLEDVTSKVWSQGLSQGRTQRHRGIQQP
ncbi:hypothetical protein BGY98DRAFT_981782 [Russula aff. rugulosa BPL654]|nr:hypothetical protein BGY98DRAFT_981782 [Russula aff. rugulosa BPL654]